MIIWVFLLFKVSYAYLIIYCKNITLCLNSNYICFSEKKIDLRNKKRIENYHFNPPQVVRREVDVRGRVSNNTLISMCRRCL